MSQMQPTAQSQQSGQLTNSQNAQQSQTQAVQTQQGQTRSQLYPTKNYLSKDVRTSSIACLNQCLVDLAAANMQLKAAHWNVRGPNFYQLHELFEDLIEDFDDHIDMVAERATALGGQAQATAPIVAQRANVPQMSPTLSDEHQILQQISTTLATLDSTLYDNINEVSERGDLDTADLLNEVSRDVSEALWFVEAHLQNGGQTVQQFQTQQI